MSSQPWTSRQGYYYMYGWCSPETIAAMKNAERVIDPVSAPSAMAAPFPDTNLQQNQRLGTFTTSDQRAGIQAGKADRMASAETIQQMKVAGKATVSPLLSGIFPLILLAGIMVLVILKK